MNARVRRYKSVGGAAGLVRVEVLVPPSGRETILSQAERLRSEYRRSRELDAKTGDLNGRLTDYYDQAMTKFGSRCLWNAKPSRSVEGLKVIAERLRTYGGMDAWRLAAAIRKEVEDAAG